MARMAETEARRRAVQLVLDILLRNPHRNLFAAIDSAAQSYRIDRDKLFSAVSSRLIH
ncbi:MAG: hypothetical protein Q4G46_06885 [Propionibacteriaceae bacterium]|nr:hypothetical protein [Propionibacteriaceae bacterium]